jgi:hypothetical protein
MRRDGQPDGQTDMTMLIVAFRNFTKVLKKRELAITSIVFRFKFRKISSHRISLLKLLAKKPDTTPRSMERRIDLFETIKLLLPATLCWELIAMIFPSFRLSVHN